MEITMTEIERKEEIQKRLREIKKETKELEKELEDLGKSYDEKFFQELKDKNPGLWYRWTEQENVFFHFTGFSCMYNDLIRPVKRFTFEIDTRVSVLSDDKDYLKITVDHKKDAFTFDEGEFVPVDVEEIRLIVKAVQNEQMKELLM